jgi:hypothetical protein
MGMSFLDFRAGGRLWLGGRLREVRIECSWRLRYRVGVSSIDLKVAMLLVSMLVVARTIVIVRICVLLMLGIMAGIAMTNVGIGVLSAIVPGVIVPGVIVFDQLVHRMLVKVLRIAGGLRVAPRILDDLAPDAIAIAPAARTAMARTAAVGAVFGFFLGLAMGALVGLDQRLAIGDRDLVVVGMNFAEGEEAMAIAAIFDESRLQRRLYARDLGEINVAAKLFALRGLEIKLFDAIAADHDNPGLLRVGGIDKHFVGHF